LLLGALVATACATVPRAVSNRTLRIGTPDAEVSACHPVAPDHVVSSAEASHTESLDPAKINLLIWNTHKGQDNGWLEEFERLSVDQDLIVLQEAYLKDELRDSLLRQTLSWNLATTFMRYRVETGVMTASQVAPASACVQRTMEPLLSLPKSTLISRYPIKGSDETLLVANIHAVNFTLGTAAFRSQLDRLASELDDHEGPVIVAGDFNSWSQSRLSVLDEVLVEGRLMRRVAFNDKNPRAIFGNTVDHVYYRDLTVIDGRVLEANTSDHAPIWVQFGKAGESAL
jgi:endonuclease/exonuclease/phosphatase (EEP) superfamily protein YafD